MERSTTIKASVIDKIKALSYFNDFVKVLLVLLLCLPLFFINIRNDIDWGDDNAHYLLQAKYIIETTPQTHTQYIYNINCAVLGPPSYPIGFPLLLSVVYGVKGLNLHAFSIFMTLALVALCLLMVLYYKHKIRYLTSVFIILLVAFNPLTLAFKSEIMSEIPFAVVLLATLLLYQKYKNIFAFVLVGLLSGYLISIRVIGVVLPLAIGADTLRNIIQTYLQQKKPLIYFVKPELIKLTIIVVSSFVFYFLLNYVLFKIPTDSASGYLFLFRWNNFYTIVLNNLASYTEALKLFFNPVNDKWIFLPLITKSIVFTMILLGFIKKLVKNTDVTEFMVILYVLVLLVYPYNQCGFRFLFPLLPFLMYYAVIGLKTVHLGIKVKTQWKVVFLGLLVLIQYIYGINQIMRMQNEKQEGPCTADSWGAFDYIKNNTADDAVIAFVKPRALALFTNRRCMANETHQEKQEPLVQKFDEVGVNYYLLYCQKPDEPWSTLLAEMINPALEKYIASVPNEISLVWNNPRFKLYKRVKLR
ncbi:MAG: hypothetical protein WCQ95_09985 [Bacteroidota bacterium]